ncbi:hypothetical protein GIB67_036067 [Kingdonia uniflora]|uniref:Protein kinase domain-containing protein n=1 Tax=Kingdonia uniflora TaxID=39325 RepID=A0A7J7N8Y9_9MAGN|nr:hypothetical protein GIB67_036067 [Kingdonia uniflora]
MKFTHREVEDITNRFASQNIVFEENLQIFEGIIVDNPVLVKCFSTNDKCFWSELMILSRVRHRNISNLVGYCYIDTSTFLLFDKPSGGSLDSHLQCDELAKNLSWNARWDIALAIRSCLRYLHEDCLDGPILHRSVSSCHIVFSHGSSPMLTEFSSAKSLKDCRSFNGNLSMDGPIDERCQPMKANGQLYPDVHAYGLFLLEPLTGQRVFDSTFVDWALPLLENGSLRQVMDPRLLVSGDAKEVFLWYPPHYYA